MDHLMAKILYVEDHPPAQLLMRAIIGEMTPHTLIVADSGAAARQAASTNTPDLYIIDLDLPDTDGISLAGALKTIHPAPVLIVSAYAEAIKGTALGDLAYLAKPLDPEHVAETIQRSLG
jgi:CheY-like chemotaxis protein